MPAKYFRAPEVASAEFGDELAIMDVRSGAYVAFNRTAADVWKLLDTPSTLDELTETLAQRYSMDPGLCRADIDELLTELQDMKVIGRRDG